jgi:muconolactone delta-isomerase
MEYLFIVGRTDKWNTETVTQDAVREEVNQAKTLYAAGTVRQIWSRGDVGGACLLLEVANEEEGLATINSLPLMKKGFLKIDVALPLKPYYGFASTN